MPNQSQSRPELLERLRRELSEPLGALDLDTLGRHNRAYTQLYASDRFGSFVETEWPYYMKVLDLYRRLVPPGARILDVGTFVPVMPLLLSWSGYNVVSVEKLDLYGDALGPMVKLLGKHRVDFKNTDIVESASNLGCFDAVNLLAVIEHLVGSPRELLLHLRELLGRGGKLFVVVPNQARLARRLAFALKGVSVQPDYGLYFESVPPFEGHHREYTLPELRYALGHTGYSITEIGSVKYPPVGGVVKRLVTRVGNALPVTFHQALYAVGENVEA